MPFKDFLSAILPLKEFYGKDKITVVITGGEPLLRKDLAESGRELRKNGFRWGIVSNGYLYNEKKHNELLNAGMGAITISLDGTRENHDWLRGLNGSFDRTAHAIELIAASERLNFDVVTCVNQRNISELESIKQFLVEKKVPAWRLFTIAPIGRAKSMNELNLTRKQILLMMEFIETSRKEGKIQTNFSCEGYVSAFEKRVRDQYFFCRAGINIGSILADGSISACPNIDRDFKQGNIYHDNFLDVWENNFKEFRYRDWLKTGQCKDCRQFDNCLGNGFHLHQKGNEEVLFCHHNLLKNKTLDL